MTMKSTTRYKNLEIDQYRETDHDVAAVAEAALGYIMVGDEVDRPYDLRGLGVYGVIGMLREHDDVLHGDDAALDADQQGRLEQIESDIERAVGEDMQYFPFGHNNREKFIVGNISRNPL